MADEPLLETRDEDDFLIVRILTDSLTDETVIRRVKDELESIADHPNKGVIIDCALLDFQSPLAGREFLAFHREMESKGKIVCFCDVSSFTRQMYAMEGLNELFFFKDTIEEAKEFLRRVPT